MWIKASGDLTENVSQVSTAVSTHVVGLGDKACIVDASIWPLRFELCEKIVSSFETLEFVLLTHAHFDHLGCVPYLREKFPHIKIVSGRLTADLLTNKDYVEQLRLKNEEAAKAVGDSLDLSPIDWFKALQVDITLSDGDILELGEGVEVKLLESPGHTEDSVCYYFKPDLVLAAGESLGQYSGRDKITPTYASSYQDSINSYKKLNALEIHVLSLPHSGVITGDLVSKFLTELPIEMEKYRKHFQDQVAEGFLVEEIVGKVCAEWAEEERFPEGPFHDAHKEIISKMVKQSVTPTKE